MGYYCMMVNGQKFCMKFDEYKTLGWVQEIAVAGKELFPNRDNMRSVDEVIADRNSRDRNLNNIGETL